MKTLRSHPDVSGAEITPDGVRVMAAIQENLLPVFVEKTARFGLRSLKIF